MKIGIDISQIVYEGSGVARYTHYLVDAILNGKTKHEFVFFFSSLRGKLDANLESRIMKSGHSIKKLSFPPTILDILWNRLHIVPIETFIGDIDVFISSDWTQPPSRKAKLVTVIHDMIIYEHPETSTTSTKVNATTFQISPNIVATHKRRHAHIKAECDHIITDSESSKSDIEKHLAINAAKVSVVYPYIEISKPTAASVKNIKSKFDLNNPYILTVGKIEPRKNIPNLIKAFQKANIEDAELVIVGGEGWGDSLPEFTKQSNIKVLGYVSDDELYSLYMGAMAYFAPSIYEGFGYPILEAMKLGKPVAVSKSSSLTEIAGAAGLTFDPQSIQSISNSITKVLGSKKLQNELSTKSLKRSQEFTQKNFLKSFMNVIETV